MLWFACDRPAACCWCLIRDRSTRQRQWQYKCERLELSEWAAIRYMKCLPNVDISLLKVTMNRGKMWKSYRQAVLASRVYRKTLTCLKEDTRESSENIGQTMLYSLRVVFKRKSSVSLFINSHWSRWSFLFLLLPQTSLFSSPTYKFGAFVCVSMTQAQSNLIDPRILLTSHERRVERRENKLSSPARDNGTNQAKNNSIEIIA